MRAGDFLADGVRGKFDMAAAQDAGHFQVLVGLAQGDGSLTMGTGNLLTDVSGGEFNMSAANPPPGY
jgi:hypothetical protein